MGLDWRGNLKFPGRAAGEHPRRPHDAACEIRQQKPRVVILPYWEGRHPDHYRTSELGYEACFLAGLEEDRSLLGAAPAVQDPVLLAVREREAELRRRYHAVLRAPHGVAVRLRVAVRRKRRGRRTLSRSTRKSASGTKVSRGSTAT